MSLQMVEAYADPLDDDTEDDVRWFEYCRIASTLCREDILTVVLDELQSPVSPSTTSSIQPYIPHTNPAARESITVLAAVGQALQSLVANVVDTQINLRMVVGVYYSL